MARLVTPRLLKRYDPCSLADFFFKLYPEGTEITVALCVQHATKADWDWASRRLLSKAKQKDFRTACDQLRVHHDSLVESGSFSGYERIIPEKQAYEKAKEEYEEAHSEFFATWRTACADADTVYVAAVAKAGEEYSKNTENKGHALLAYYDAITGATVERDNVKAASAKAKEESLRSINTLRVNYQEAERKYCALKRDIDMNFSGAMKIFEATEFAIAWQTETDQRFIEVLDTKNKPRTRKKEAVAA